MRDIIRNDFAENEYQIDIYNDNWPVVYILKNDEYVYIGETIHYLERMRRHKREKKEMEFRDSYMIADLDFNISVTKHYEALMISLVQADARYIVTNKNSGIQNANYYNKFVYDKKFKDLFHLLKDEGIVSQTLRELYNSENFKFSPYKELNNDQNHALYEILQVLLKKTTRPLIVSGGPGTGKTTLAVYTLLYLKQDKRFRNKEIGFVVPGYELRASLRNTFSNIENLSSSIILKPGDVKNKEYDIIICDEAHRLNGGEHTFSDGQDNELEWILEQSKQQIFLYDEHQVTIDSKTNHELFMQKMEMMNCKKVFLDTQMRVEGGGDYLVYIRKLLEGDLFERKVFINQGKKYDFKLFTSLTQMKSEIERLNDEYSLCKLCAGNAWPESSEENKKEYDIEIQGEKFRWTTNSREWLYGDEEQDVVGNVRNIQGYELNYAGVIIGEDLRYSEKEDCVYVDPTKYYGKRREGEREGEIEKYVRNVYYVLLTRGIRGTYVYVCDEALRDYMSHYIEQV